MASGDGGNRHRTWNIQHSRRLAQYNARLERILRQAVTRAASSVTRRNATATADTPFTFKADRVLDSEIDSLMKDLAAEITAVTGGAERTEWDRAQSQAVRYLTDLYDVAEQSKGRQDAFNDTMLTMRSRNLDALDEFQKRKIGGMTLSEKVWDCTADFKGQMECAIDTALLEGKSAASLAQSVQGLLDNPDALFRRVRDAGGTLRLSKAAKAFHPGKGKYRSAHKNAMRLARTEINMAYRASDCNVAQMLDCVVGIRVNLSNNHNCEGVPTGQFTDICDQLAGDYPKDFKFVGWHPQCRCFITYINKTDEEFWRDLENGENNASVNTVKDVPDAFKQWVSDNSDRLDKAEAKGSTPYFIKDNKETVERIRTERKEAKPDKPTNEELSYMQTVSDKPKASSVDAKAENDNDKYSTIPTSNGNLRIYVNHTGKEKNENIRIGSYLANKHGYEIDLLERSNGAKSPDSFNRTLGIIQEYKSNGTATKSSIDNLIRFGKKQADNLVLEIKSNISIDDLSAAMNDRVKRCENIKTITIIIDEKDHTYTREEIIADGFKIQSSDLK